MTDFTDDKYREKYQDMLNFMPLVYKSHTELQKGLTLRKYWPLDLYICCKYLPH